MSRDTFNRAIQEAAAAKKSGVLDPGVLLAIQTLQAQINALQANVNNNAAGSGGNLTESAGGTTIVTGENTSGVAREYGDVVIVSASGDKHFTVPTVEGQRGTLGAVWSDTPDGTAPAIAIGGTGDFCLSGTAGVMCDATVNGAIVPGDLLISGAGAFAVLAPTKTTEGIFAVALQALPAATGVIDAFIIPAPRFDFIRYEVYTASDAATIEVSENVAIDAQHCLALVYDLTTERWSFPTALSAPYAYINNDRDVITRHAANHNQLINASSDWTVAADQSVVIWVPEIYANNHVGKILFESILRAWQLSTIAVDGAWNTLTTTAKTIAGAINEIELEIDGKKEYHGIEAIGAVTFVDGTHVLSVASITYWYQGVEYTTASPITCDIDTDNIIADNTVYWFHFNDATGALKCSTACNFKTQVPVAVVFWNGTAGAINREWHNHTRDIDWHEWAHDTIGLRYEAGLDKTHPTTATDNQLSITGGTVHDEDLTSTITNPQTTCRIIHKVSGAVYTWVNSSLPYAGSGVQPQYLNTGAYALTDVGASDFVCMWVYVTNDVDRPIFIFPTHAAAAHNTIALARAETQPVLAGLNLSPELKLIYRFIYKGNGDFQESNDYRLTQALPSGGVATVTAGAVSFIPGGSIAATTVQTAIDELDAEKVALTQLPKRITLWGDEMTAIVGNAVSTSMNTSQQYQLWGYQTSAYSDGDSAGWGFVCAAGTYTFTVLSAKFASAGITDYYVDGAVVDAGYDWYAAATSYNEIRSFSVTLTAGYHTLKYVMNGKNAASSSYRHYVTKIRGKLAAD